MNIQSLLPLLSGIVIVCTGLFVLSRNHKSKLNFLFFLECITLFLWLFGYSRMYAAIDKEIALMWARIGFLGIISIPIFIYHFYLEFLKLQKIKAILLMYSLGIFFLLISQTNFIYQRLDKYYWGWYPRGGIIYPFYVLFFIGVFVRALVLLYIHLKRIESGIQRNQLKYLLVAFFIATFGAVDFVAKFGIKVYPFGYIAALGWIVVVAFAIVKHRLMDIKVAITRTGIFIAVYTLVLGLPFAVAIWFKGWLIDIFGAGWWMLPQGLTALLATVGPFIYIYIERKAEDKLLKEQRRYQDTLKQASVGMTRIRNLRRLLDLIAHIVTKTVRISYTGIYLYNQENDEYVLQISRDKGRTPIPKLNADNPLIAWIMVKHEPLIYEEIKRRMQDTPDTAYKYLEENMRLLTASVIIPSFLENRLLGFIVLGDKLSGQIYTPEDLNIFQVLASQAALAIENAQFYEETKEMQEQIAQAEKMATIGTMADGLSHQINNRFYALSLIAGDTIDSIKMADTSKCTPEIKEMIEQINYALGRIQANVIQGGEVVKGILKYTRKGDEGLEAIALDQILNGTLDMVQYKVKLSEIDLVRDYPGDLPKIKGNLVQLQEAFFNFIDNAYDATMERRTLLKEPGYKGRITVSARPKDDNLEVTIQDNGMGIKDDNIKKVFTPFFTTKTSSRKGTGLGLYVIRRIIADIHRGKISFESDYKVGTRFILELPIAK